MHGSVTNHSRYRQTGRYYGRCRIHVLSHLPLSCHEYSQLCLTNTYFRRICFTSQRLLGQASAAPGPQRRNPTARKFLALNSAIAGRDKAFPERGPLSFIHCTDWPRRCGTILTTTLRKLCCSFSLFFLTSKCLGTLGFGVRRPRAWQYRRMRLYC